MSSKRKFSDYNADSSAAGQTHDHAPSYQGSKHKRKKGPSQEKPTSVNWLKKRARTIERRLNREDISLPANVKHDLEKELDHHRQKLEHIADSRQRSNMIKKYHMVRFFERKKATRLAKQIQTQLETAKDEEERKKLQAHLHIAEVDALYAKYHPHRERYISLYPVSSGGAETKTEDASSAAARSLQSERPPLWSVIEKAAKKGTQALVQIQERKSADAQSKPSQDSSERQSADKSKQSKRAKAKGASALDPTSSRKDNRKQQQQQQAPPESPDSGEDNDSDGGFFEDG
ncbi:hypothetical protein GGR50DRAFT_643979 [Xylaria sp. CBS 124048]|nr:hypothetical protein GGR50DRAFT_643979 [Xylaria sp. CBS 124048]